MPAVASSRRLPDRRVDFIIISVLAAAVLMFAYDKWWTSGPLDKSIAVLAFENMSGDPEQDYFSDGIAEELLNALAQIPELHVTSRSSAFSFKGKDISVPDVARQLNVAHVLEGSVRKVGNRVRITAQLIAAESDSHLWSETYDRNLDDIFAVQDDIAEAISDELEVRLISDSGKAMAPTVTKAASVDAYDAYLRARELINQRDDEALWEAYKHLERALRLDHNFAPANAQLAIVILLGTRRLDATQFELDIAAATEYLDRAQELDPGLADGHGGRALLALTIDDPESTVIHAEKALAANPSYIDAMNWLQHAYRSLGRYADSDATLEQMLAVDPLTLVGRSSYASRLCYTGRVDEARGLADELLKDSPAHGYAAHADAAMFFEGNVAEAMSWGLKLGAETGTRYGYVWSGFVLARKYDEVRRLFEDAEHLIAGIEGRWDKVVSDLEQWIEDYPLLDQLPLDMAHALYYAGRFEEAVTYYEQFFDAVPEGRLYTAAVRRGPLFEPMPVISLMRLAQARRKSGDVAGAQAAAEIARQGNATLRAAGRSNNNRDMAEAMIAAFDGNSELAISSIRAAIQHGLRVTSFFEESIFEEMRDDPRFMSLQDELDMIVAAETEKVLQLVCFHNPTPNDWQPLPETCEGVVEQAASL